MGEVAGHPQQLIDLAFAALDHGFDSVAASGGPLIPFAFYELNGERRLERAVAERVEVGLAMLRTRVADMQDATTAIAYDGYLTTGEGRFDAIHVEARHPSGATLTLAQRYELKGRFRKHAERVGNAVLIADA